MYENYRSVKRNVRRSVGQKYIKMPISLRNLQKRDLLSHHISKALNKLDTFITQKLTDPWLTNFFQLLK
jgi:hypothetical protein